MKNIIGKEIKEGNVIISNKAGNLTVDSIRKSLGSVSVMVTHEDETKGVVNFGDDESLLIEGN